MIIQEPVQATIWFTLNHYAYTDAIFLAERLHFEVNTEDTLYLLATCYYRSGKPVSTYSILSDKNLKSPECRLLLARCCCDLKKYSEAEEALLGKIKQMKLSSNPSSNISPLSISLTLDELKSEFKDAASLVSQTLAFICSKTERQSFALDYYKKSLKLNPFLWSSFEALIQLGAKPDSAKIFNMSNVDFDFCYGNNPLIYLWNNNMKVADTLITSQQTQQSTNAHLKENNNRPIDIYSPFAVIKPTLDNGSYEVITPDNNNWVSTKCFAPYKQNENFKGNNKLQSQQTFDDSNHSTPEISNYDTPVVRSSFGVFPLKDTPNLSQMIINKDISESNKLVNNSSNAPARKPQTRRNQQLNSPLMPPSTRNNNFPKLHIFNQSLNINSSSIDTGLNNYQNPANTATNVQQSDLGLRRSSRLFNSPCSVKENSKTVVTRNMNQENNNKKIAGSTRAQTRRTKRQSNTISNTNNSQQQKESELNELNKGESVNKLSNNVNHTMLISEDLKQAGLKWQKASAEGLLTLLVELGKASFYLGQFQCQKAIDVLMKLPLKHLNSGWVLTALGKAYFEMAKYDQAIKYFQDAQKSEPYRLKGTEYYSTALWHLQKEVKLSMLAQEMIEFDKFAPQTWCVAGNCFSLQKEHETAIKFLQRAIQVDPDFAYAYTLLGHELVLTEEMDHAMACFRNAIRIDPRHYNAWYGIGMIYYKQEKYQLAELYYRKALQISPYSPVLMCNIGVVQHSLGKTDLALQTLNKGIELDSKNPLCKFHRASIHFAMDKHQLALAELEELKQIVPKESLVYFLIGKVHKRLGNTHLALMNFSWAMDLDPKGANNQIKEVIDKQYANEDEDVICLEDTGNSLASLNVGSDSSLRLQPHPHHESNSSMDAEEDNFDAAEVMDEVV